jgi:hypothetical protein
MYVFNKLYNCGVFQGEGKQKHYFEGWYFKHVDRDGNNVISVIPGISYEEDERKSHAFIQIIDGSTYETYYLRYSIDEFKFSTKRFEIQIGNNFFSESKISLDINKENIGIQGNLHYSEPLHWPSGILSPNSMGWYAFIPVMECYHGVLSLHHNISGQIKLNNRMISFDGGMGYIEKDWGTSFPSSWVWLQSNHFDIDNISFMLSIAKIPWRRKSFTGLITGLWYDNKLYRFTTYAGAKIDYLQISDKETKIKLSDKRYNLSIEAFQGKSGTLQAPIKGAMTGNVLESISGTASIKLNDKKTGRCLLETKARCCGMEVAGNTQELVSLP